MWTVSAGSAGSTVSKTVQSVVENCGWAVIRHGVPTEWFDGARAVADHAVMIPVENSSVLVGKL